MYDILIKLNNCRINSVVRPPAWLPQGGGSWESIYLLTIGTLVVLLQVEFVLNGARPVGGGRMPAGPTFRVTGSHGASLL